MNNFEKQITKAAKVLCEKQNAELKVPPQPNVSKRPQHTTLKWWFTSAAALCIGYWIGAQTPFHSSETPQPLAKHSTTILHDTIFTTLLDTIFLEREVPVYLSSPKEVHLASAEKESDITYSPSPSSEQSYGRNILDDTIHYTLLVSL